MPPLALPPLAPSFLAAVFFAPDDDDFFASVLAAALLLPLLVVFAVDLLAVDLLAVFLAPVVFLAVDLLAPVVFFAVVFLAVDVPVDFLAVDLLAVFLAPVDFVALDVPVDFFAVDLLAVFLAPVDLLAELFLAVDPVALAVVVFRVELVAARVTFGTVASSLAGTRTSCVKDVRPDGRTVFSEKIALPGAGCQHLVHQTFAVSRFVRGSRTLSDVVVGVLHARSCARVTAQTSATTPR